MCGECTMFDVIVALESCVRCGVWSRGSIGDIVTVRALFRCVLSQTTCALGCRGCVNISQTRMTKSNQSDTRETTVESYLDPTDVVSSLGVVFSPFAFSFSFARSSYCKSVLVSISRFEMKVLDFLLEMSLGHQLQSAIIMFLVAECRLLNDELHNKYFNPPNFPACILCRLSNMLSVGGTSSHSVSNAWTLSFLKWTFDKSLKSKRASVSPRCV